jgi:hypothetical protein
MYVFSLYLEFFFTTLRGLKCVGGFLEKSNCERIFYSTFTSAEGITFGVNVDPAHALCAIIAYIN